MKHTKHLTFVVMICASIVLLGLALWGNITSNKHGKTVENSYILSSDTRSGADLHISSIDAYLETLNKTLASGTPILNLLNLDGGKSDILQTVLHSDDVKRLTIGPDGKPFRLEVFGVYSLSEGDKIPECAQECYRVELYNYAVNKAALVYYDNTRHKISRIQVEENVQPGVPPHLQTIAKDIALNSKDLRDLMKVAPEKTKVYMPGARSSLIGSVCQRSGHLCVSPTFVDDNRAIWGIVDLTDFRLIGVRTSEFKGVHEDDYEHHDDISETEVEAGAITEKYCKHSNSYSDDLWSFDYVLTSSDGVNFMNVKYKGEKLIDSAKLMDWHVSYSTKDGFGYSDAIGCPAYSQAAVVPVRSHVVRAINRNGQVIGKSFSMDFETPGWPNPCNYYYQERLDMYNDGKVRVVASSHGRGCGDDGTYRPITRIELPSDKSKARVYQDNAWQDVAHETWKEQSKLTPEQGTNLTAKFSDILGLILPKAKEFSDTDRGDNAYVYFVEGKDKDEGKSELPTLGLCCNTNYEQGPERFVQADEQLSGEKTVLWYVPQLKNDATPGNKYCWADEVFENGRYKENSFPCDSGPVFEYLPPRKQ